MRQAIDPTTMPLRRRLALLGGAAAVVTAGAIQGQAAPPGADAELVALSAELLEIEKRHDAICRPYTERGEEVPGPLWRKITGEVPRLHELEERMGGLPAVTLAGALAKARAVASIYYDAAPNPGSDEYLMHSLAVDLVRLLDSAGGAA